MIRVMKNERMGKSDLGWLNSSFHFSFAEYYNPSNMNFGVLRVINDDRVAPNSGFPTHPHENMEIVSYVVDGVLTHRDSMGNERELTRGQVQYMSAGNGVTHSEYNLTDAPLRFLQIWIFPDKAGYTPNYGDYPYEWKDREDQWLQIVSGGEGEAAPVKLHQDMNISVISLSPGKTAEYSLEQGRQAYLVQIEGEGQINGNALNPGDGVEVVEEEQILLKAQTLS
ncbi:MAG: pirin family protein, partial [Anaerovoracaceae bacterium]